MMNSIESNFTLKRDKDHLVTMNDEEEGPFYETDDVQSQIINLIVPEGTKMYLGLHLQDPNLKLCWDQLGKCYRARVVVFAQKFPGHAKFSKYYQVNFI